MSALRMSSEPSPTSSSIAAIPTLFEGFEDAIPASERWQLLARQKVEEVDAVIARAQRMKDLLDHVLECRCLKLEDCAALIAAG